MELLFLVGCCSSVVEHFLGKEEVMGSSPISSSWKKESKFSSEKCLLGVSCYEDVLFSELRFLDRSSEKPPHRIEFRF
jgi:hypothetical protein